MTDTGKTADPAALVVARSDLCLSHPTPTQRVTSVLLNSKNFHAWSISLRLYLGGKRKIRWLLDKEVQPNESDPKYDEWFTENCIILGYMLNSMEEWIYTMFMYHRPSLVFGLRCLKCMPMTTLTHASLSSIRMSPIHLKPP